MVQLVAQRTLEEFKAILTSNQETRRKKPGSAKPAKNFYTNLPQGSIKEQFPAPPVHTQKKLSLKHPLK